MPARKKGNECMTRADPAKRAFAVEFSRWLESNPYPNLHKLIAEFSGYWNIPDPQWQQYRAAVKDWEARRNARFYTP
jgi:hypothetical protein